MSIQLKQRPFESSYSLCYRPQDAAGVLLSGFPANRQSVAQVWKDRD